MKYYNIQIRKKHQDTNEQFGLITNVVAVSSDEDLKTHIKETVDEFDIADNYIDDTIEITEQEAISRYETSLKNERIRRYLARNKYDELSIRDFCKKQKYFQSDQGYFKVVKEEDHLIWLKRKLHNQYDLSEMNVSQYEEIFTSLMRATTDEEFDEIASRLDKIQIK